MKKVIKSCLVFSVLCAGLVFFACNTASKESKTDGKACEKAADCCAAAPDITSAELVIVAHVTVLPEYKDELVKAFEAVVKGTRTEAGNISYTLYEDVNNPLKFTFIEYWKSQDAIDAHNASAHFQEFAKTVTDKATLDVSILKQKF